MNLVATAANGGCGPCACHCHGDELEAAPGHLSTCRFADEEYVPPSFAAATAIMANRRAEVEILRWLKGEDPR